MAATAGAAQYAGIAQNAAAPSVSATMNVDGSGMSRQITLAEYAGAPARPLRQFALDMTKRMHLIVVSDDLSTYQHLHPILGADGRFRLGVKFPRPAIYHVYADAAPAGFGRRVFRFDVRIGWTKRLASRDAGTPSDTVTLGPYVVRLSALRVPARHDTAILVAITTRDKEPATDLHPYLGAFAHIVAIGTSDLSYTHVHAMDARAMAMGTDMDEDASPVPANTIVPATMSVHLDLRNKGTYKTWVEFQGGSKVYAAPFVITAY